MTGTRPRLAHLVSHPIQYFVPLYRELHRRGRIDLTVFYRSDRGMVARVDPQFGTAFAWDVPLHEGYRWRMLRGATRPAAGAPLDPSGLDVVAHLARGRFDALWVHGYSYLANIAAIGAARALGIPVALREEANLIDTRSALRQTIRQALAMGMVRLSAAGLYIGEANRHWLEHSGMAPERLFHAPYAVDNQYFRQLAARLEPQRPSIRGRYGFAERDTVFVFAGKLIEKKAPLDLVQALSQIATSQRTRLLVAGDGPLRVAVERMVASLHLDNVVITGFLNQSEIAQAYIAGDVLVLPSRYRETWGLVVNEAMNFGLPAIVSDRVGCAPDLVRDGKTGFVFPAGDIGQLAALMRRLAENSQLRHQMGKAASDLVLRYGIEQAADGIEQAVSAMLER